MDDVLKVKKKKILNLKKSSYKSYVIHMIMILIEIHLRRCLKDVSTIYHV